MNEKRLKPALPSWEPMAAFACFAGSVVSLALGFALTTEWVINAQRHPLLHGVGVTLLIVGIPILILGGHCLDLMERKAKNSHGELSAQRNGGTKPLHVLIVLLCSVLVLVVGPNRLNAQHAFESLNPTDAVATATGNRIGEEIGPKSQDPSAPLHQWLYGGFVDLGYLLDFNHPENRLFRSRGTTFHVDRVHLKGLRNDV